MVERPIGGRANGRCGRGLEWRHRGDFRKPCTGLRGEARASLCIIIPVRAARCALQLLGQARVCAFLSSSSPSSPSSSSSYFCTLAGASSLPFSTSTTTSAEPRCSSASNNHSIRACGKSTCWLPLNESERARARTPLCHRRRTIKSRSSRECTVTIGPHSIRINRLPVPRRTSWSANCDIADLGIFHFGQVSPPIKPGPRPGVVRSRRD